jgi:hypothetical protein
MKVKFCDCLLTKDWDIHDGVIDRFVILIYTFRTLNFGFCFCKGHEGQLTLFTKIIVKIQFCYTGLFIKVEYCLVI